MGRSPLRNPWNLMGLALLAAVALAFAWPFVAASPPVRQHVLEVRAWTESRTLVVVVAHAECGTEPGVRVEDRRDRVVVEGRMSEGNGCDDIGLQTTVEAGLDDVLGSRRIEVLRVPSGSGREPLICTVDDAPSDRCTT